MSQLYNTDFKVQDKFSLVSVLICFLGEVEKNLEIPCGSLPEVHTAAIRPGI
jgi:hypothetical protein